MTSFTDTWNAGYEATPADSENASQGAARIRAERRDLRERLVVDHSWAGDSHDGKHKKVVLRDQASDPTLDAGDSSLYTKVVNGLSRLFHRNSLGVAQLDLPGEIRMYGGSAAPVGWLLCNGGVVSRTTYAGLFAIIGTAYNLGGEAGTDFRLPYFNGRSPIGLGQGDTAFGGGTGTNRALGNRGGAETHTLSASEMPVHNHGVHQGSGNYSAGGNTPWDSGGAPNQVTASAGGGATHNNMHPFVTVNFIIRY